MWYELQFKDENETDLFIGKIQFVPRSKHSASKLYKAGNVRVMQH
jgi:hypothetical protein